jgi:acetyl-CoA acyltransferase 1
MERANRILAQLGGAPSKPALNANMTSGRAGVKADDDVVIVSALRTPICRARRGGFKDTYIEDLLVPVMKGVLAESKIDPKEIGDIVCGTVLGGNLQKSNQTRISSLMAGIPDSVPVHIINRQCSSGLQAVAHCAASIKAGFYDVGLACGVESMSKHATPDQMWSGGVNPKIFQSQQAKDCLLPMGITSENVAKKWGVTREEQDQLAAQSHARAAKAIKTGRFRDEIVPITTKRGVVSQDDGVRPATTREGLAKLRPAFQTGGSTTAGNASQVSDGAAAVLLCRRSKAKELGLPIIGKFVSFSVVGVPPNVMGIGPAYAIPAALNQAGLSTNDVDIFEINEAFASQACMTVRHLGLDWAKVNPNGGAIALGHPLGMTGARMTATLLAELKKTQQKRGVVSMCIGSGMGAAAVLERE